MSASKRHDHADDVLASVKDVSFSYEESRKVLDGVSFDVHAGELLCILGSNGSGKSTLARMLNGLLVPDSGTVEVLGMPTADGSVLDEIRANCGMVFQNPADQMVASTVEEDIAFGPLNLGLDELLVEERVAESLCKVGLAGFEERDTSALSGGQQQRVAVAGALAMRSKILVFDEATSMLDPRGRKAMLRMQRHLCDEGIAVIAITHFMAEAAQADRVMVMDGGRIVADAPPEAVLADAAFMERESLSVPYAAKLSRDLQCEGVDVGLHISDQSLVEALREMLSDPGARHGSRCRPADEQMDEAEGIIGFEGVSFTYASKRELKRWKASHDEARSQTGNVRASNRRAKAAKRSWGADPDSIWALQDVSLGIRNKEILGIIGHTGSGKSTMMRLANGLLDATSGRVLVNGTPIHSRRSHAEALRDVGVVLQYPERQLFAQTVYEDVAFGPRNLGADDAELARRVGLSLDAMGLEAKAISGSSPFALSGGQQRRVAIAGVIAMAPKVLMLDEPAAGLDPKSHMALLDLLRKLRDDMGMTIVLISHSMDDIAALCDRVVALDKGRIFASGTPLEVFADQERLAEVGLGMPHALQYADALGIPICDSVPTSCELARMIAAALEADADDASKGSC